MEERKIEFQKQEVVEQCERFEGRKEGWEKAWAINKNVEIVI
jgi:hypothetical protein